MWLTTVYFSYIIVIICTIKASVVIMRFNKITVYSSAKPKNTITTFLLNYYSIFYIVLFMISYLESRSNLSFWIYGYWVWYYYYWMVYFISFYSFYYYLYFISVLNFGPQHPATHGVLRVIGILHGEIILSINIEIGLLHRGTEKLIELGYSAALIIPYLARLDYVSTFTQELLFIQLMELLFTYYISSVASLWRIVLVEFYRNLNHCLNITTHAIDIGLFTTMVWQFEEREKLITKKK